MNRRNFVKSTTLASASAFIPFSTAFGNSHVKRKFKLCLNPGIIGVNADQRQALQYAIQFGYEAIVSMPNQLSEWTEKELKDFNRERIKNNISWGSTNLPVEFRKDEGTFKKGLEILPKYAKALQDVGATRMNTWVMPMHSSLTYSQNMKQHTDRLKACAKIVNDFGVKLGIEYVGAKKTMIMEKYAFIRTFAECKELIENINESNVGYVLDSFHWYCAEDSAKDILSLTPDQIITVDINDGQVGLSRDDQDNLARELPMSTGIIDLKPFIGSLTLIGYDGPVRTEPFNKTLNEMKDEEALKLNMESLQKALKLIE